MYTNWLKADVIRCSTLHGRELATIFTAVNKLHQVTYCLCLGLVLCYTELRWEL